MDHEPQSTTTIPPEINQLFESYFSRKPSIKEANACLFRTNKNGVSIPEIEAELATSPEFADSVSTLAGQDCGKAVTKIYQTLLKRNPDDDGMNTYKRKIQAEKSAAKTIRAIIQSAEYRQQAITLLHIDLLGRMPNPISLVEKIKSTTPISAIANEIRSTQEYLQKKADNSREKAEISSPLRKLGTAFRQADQIIFNLASGPIGDAVVSTAHINGVRSALEQLGRHPQLVIIASNIHQQLFESYSQEGFVVVESDAGNGLAKAEEVVARGNSCNTLLLDFAQYHGERPSVNTKKVNSTSVTSGLRLIRPAVELYTKHREGDRRVTNFLEDLLTLPPKSLEPNKAKTKIPLPNHGQTERIISEICRKNSLELKPNTRKVTISVEASSFEKRYSLENWMRVIKELVRDNNDIQIFINHFSDSMPGYTRADVENLIQKERLADTVQIFNCSLSELPSFLSQQQLVLTNDTAVSHITTAISDGPKCITPYKPNGPTPDQWAFSSKQIPIQIPPEVLHRTNMSKMTEASEDTKLINLIEPRIIAEAAKKELDSEKVNTTLPFSNYTPESIDKLYQIILGRPVDDDGLINYATGLAGNKTLTEIEWELIRSPEFIERMNELLKGSVEQTVNSLYRVILGRIPDNSGRKNYENILRHSHNRLNEVVDALINSPESQERYLKQIFPEIMQRSITPEELRTYNKIGKKFEALSNRLRSMPEAQMIKKKYSNTPYAEIPPSPEAQKTFIPLFKYLQGMNYEVILKSFFQNDHHYFFLAGKNGQQYFVKTSIDRHKEAEMEFKWSESVGKELDKIGNAPVSLSRNSAQAYIGDSFCQIQPYIGGHDLAERNFGLTPKYQQEELKRYLPHIAWAAAFFDSANVSIYKEPCSNSKVVDTIRLSNNWTRKLVDRGIVNQLQIEKLKSIASKHYPALTHGLQHGDLTPFNIRIEEKSGKPIIMDFEHGSVKNLPKGFDLALSFHRMWTVLNQPDLAKQLIREYARITKSSPDAIINMMIPSLISITCGGIMDHLNGDNTTFESHKSLLNIMLAEEWAKVYS
jgi:hypothetical protein